MAREINKASINNTYVINDPYYNNTVESSLKEFVENWQTHYKDRVQNVPLFNKPQAAGLSTSQKAHLVKVLYHIRGHFHDFLWHMGNIAPNKEAKEIILQNIAEEFGGSCRSHESLYIDFAKSLGIDLTNEMADEKNYLPMARTFNKGHLEWLIKNNWEGCFAAFSAYEKLDNIDYHYLYELVRNLGPIEEKNLLFFIIHKKVAHFETTLSSLQAIWDRNPKIVIKAFDFIGSHQLKMWQNLSKEVFSYGLAADKTKESMHS